MVETIDVWETVYVIARAVRYACQPQESMPISLHRREGRKADRISAVYILEGIPGVSTVRASAILMKFGSLQKVALATLEDLASVPNLGPIVAQAVYDAFRATK